MSGHEGMTCHATATTLQLSRGVNPQQMGDKRMHLTLKKEATKPPAKNFLQQLGEVR